MKAAYIERYGKHAPVIIGDRPVPSCGPRDLLVRVRAASVNPIDFKIRDGELRVLFKFRMPLILGSDLAGEVIHVGREAQGFAVGDEIMARVQKERIGTFAEQIAIDCTTAAPKPKALSFAEAASLPLAGLTAWQALRDFNPADRPVASGHKVLIHAGSGGVGSLAIQLAHHLGAHVATTASPRNHELLRALGADEVIDYRSQRFDELLRDYDLVLDALGGADQLASFRVLKPGGVVVSIAGLPSPDFAREQGLPLPVRAFLWLRSLKTRRAAEAAKARWVYHFMKPRGDQLAELGALVDRGALRPLVDRVLPLEKAGEALDYVATGRATGKVVLEV